MADINNKDFYSSFSAITEEVIDHNLTTCLLQPLVSYQTKNWHVSEQSKDFGIYTVAQPDPPGPRPDQGTAQGALTDHTSLPSNSVHSDQTNVRFLPVTKITLHMLKILLNKYV